MGFREHLNIEVIDTSEKQAHLLIKLDQNHMNIYDYVHGGVYFSLADSAAGSLVVSDTETWVTLNASFNFIMGTQEGTLHAYATLLKKTRKTAVIHVDVKDGNDIVCAVGTFTMYHIQ